MCLLLLGYDVHPDVQWIVAANRDEFHDRPTAPLSFWEDFPGILAGRDLREGGTWMGISLKGRFAAVTNYRDPASLKSDAPSRGMLVRDFLLSDRCAKAYLEALIPDMDRYNGFNLIAGDPQGMFYLGNRCGDVQTIPPGWHALSNRCLDAPFWPKTRRGLERMQAIVHPHRPIDIPAIFDVLLDTTQAPDNLLPDTGVGIEWERILSPIFIQSPGYGTRSSSILLLNRKGGLFFQEKTFPPGPHPESSASIVQYGPISFDRSTPCPFPPQAPDGA